MWSDRHTDENLSRRRKQHDGIIVRPLVASDTAAVTALMSEFLGYIEGIDDMSRISFAPDAAGYMVAKMIADVDTSQGFIDVAATDAQVVGFVAGIVDPPSADAAVEGIYGLGGRVTELFVGREWRGAGIGRRLMDSAEDRLINRGCGVVRIEVFAPNLLARQAYASMGYVERNIHLVKLVRHGPPAANPVNESGQ